MTNLNKNKIVLGMSGGVDSSVSAYLLKERGFEVVGVFLHFFKRTNLTDVNDARKVAERFGIEFLEYDFSERFKTNVMDYFIDTYKKGETPNPCVACNKHMKFDALLKVADDVGAYYVATGHYSKTYEKDGRFVIEMGASGIKDQSYVLYNLTQEKLSRILMPLANYENKTNVRAIADEIGLFVAKKPDSQEICFVPNDDYVAFLESKGVKLDKGSFKTASGEVLGEHNGISNYTIGQRKGLGISAKTPLYVVGIDSKTNTVMLGDNKDLFKNVVRAREANLVSIPEIDENQVYYGKIRYNSKLMPCKAKWNGDILEFTFEEPQRAITPGQSIVFYHKDGDKYLLAGGGVIEAN